MHRDVSPQNVMVGVDGVARVIDFGVAKARGRLQTTREGALKGKLAYMAPEQLSGQMTTRLADVYSAGVVLWEMLTGRRLFRADNDAALLVKVLREPRDRPSRWVAGIPSKLDALVMRSIARDPGVRFATAREMADALVHVVPPALGTEVGAWVEDTAKAVVDQRMAQLAEIESASSVSVHPPGQAQAVAESDGPALVPGARGSVPELAQKTGDDPLTAVSQPSSISVETPGRGFSRTRHASQTRTWVALGAVVMLAGLGATMLARRGGSAPSASPSPPTPSAPVPPAAPVASSPSVAAASASSTPLASASSGDPAAPATTSTSASAIPTPTATQKKPFAMTRATTRTAPCELVKTVDKYGEAHFSCPCAILRMNRPTRLLTPTALCSLGVLLAVGVTQQPALAADPTMSECLSANESSISLREDHRLQAARDQALICAALSCPRKVRETCQARVEGLTAALPTVVLGATDGAGNDLVAVGVTADGALLTTALDGRPLPIDPGSHVLRFEAAGRGPVEKTIVVAEGVQNRHIEVVMGAAQRDRARIAGFAVGGIGVAGVVVGSILGGLAIAKSSSAKGECDGPGGSCAGNTNAAATRDSQTAGTLADASTGAFIAGGALVVAGLVLVLTGGGRPRRRRSSGARQCWRTVAGSDFRGHGEADAGTGLESPGGRGGAGERQRGVPADRRDRGDLG